MPTVVKLEKDEDSRSLINRFRKLMLREQIVEEAKERRFYKKPSEIRKEKMAARKREREYRARQS